MKILAIIPARGNSKGIPRKNIRNLAGSPLIYYSIRTALNSKYISDVYVSSDDDEILHLAKNFGAKIYKRKKISDDALTLDPVIYEAYTNIKYCENKKYDYIITLQPTSPVLKTNTLDKAIEKTTNNKNIDTIISAKEDTHLTWKKVKNQFIPNYTKRVNRQTKTKRSGF